MDRLNTAKACFSYTEQLQRKGRSIGFVPTMGSLHEGHLSLIKQSIQENDETIVSIYVNPTQFSPGEDFDAYPRHIRQDLKKLADYDITAVFTPKDKDIYGTLAPDQHTQITVPSLGDHACGKSRPNFFTGITTVLYKLFQLVHPTQVYLGEKDFQQLQIVKKMVHDLNLPLKVIGCPTVREDSGLALSSRNQRLNETEKTAAAQLYRALQAAKATAQKTGDVAQLMSDVKENLLAIEGFELDYVECLAKTSLQPVETLEKPAQLLVAGTLSNTRLIDNISVS